jgi:hypothetical protein
MRRLWIVFVFIFMLFPIVTNAATPAKVTFGVYPMSIYELDPFNNSFGISFYAWWRTKNKNYKPDTSIEIVNARTYSHKFGDHGITKAGEYYTFVHYYAKINYDWNLKYFPFGHQYLQVNLEDFADTDSIIFDPDLADSRLHSEFSLPGWKIISMSVKKSTTTYDTNFGNADAPKGLFDRITMTIEIKRQGMRVFISYFIGFFMAGFLAHILYLMNTFPYPARATIFAGGIFSFIGNKYTIDQKLPLITEFTLADSIQAATFVVLFLAIITSILIELLNTTPQKRHRASLTVGIISFIGYISYIAINTYIAIVS